MVEYILAVMGCFSTKKLLTLKRDTDISIRGARVMQLHAPSEIAKPSGAYWHTDEVEEGARTLYVSGRIGIAPDGTIPEKCEARSELAWSSNGAILAAAGMLVKDIVKITADLLSPDWKTIFPGESQT